MNNKIHAAALFKLLICLTVFLFCSCEDNEKCECKFSNLDEYIQIKNSWIEPESYSFDYDFSFGDSVVLDTISVVCGESPQIDFGSSADELFWNDYFKDYFCEDDIRFYSITDVFDFFYKRWLKVSNEDHKDMNIIFSVEYKKDKRGCSYPYKLIERMENVAYPDLVGFGGVYITLLNFKD